MSPLRDPSQVTGGGRFETLAVLGRGSSGVVHRVRDRETATEVALKTLDQPDADGLYRLKQEFRSLAGIRHRNLVKLYELHVSDDECLFTMEFIEGEDFVAHVARAPDAAFPAPADGGPRLRRFLSAARQLAEGLAVLHGAGKLHRDVKPPNVLVDRQGRVVLLDFGFATPFGRTALTNEQSQGAAGSLAYMAPELLLGHEATPASDWYSAGVMFYEALAGRLPFDGRMALLVRNRKLTRLEGVAPEIAGLVEALLHNDPGARPAAAEILARLDVFDPGGARPAQSTSAAETPFVGRTAELAEMRAAFGAVAPYRPVVLHVRGTSGIGKSEMVRRFLSRLEQEEDVVVLRGRCHPHEAVPYRAFDGLIDSLSSFLTSLPAAVVETLSPRHRGALTKLFPVLGRVAAFTDVREETAELQEIRRRGFSALREMFQRLADRRRVVLWIDDVQWSDPDSAALARELLRPPDPPALMLVLSYRAEDRDAVASFAAPETDERGTAAVCQIELGPLPEDATRELASLLASGADLDFGSVVRETGGSPFFVDQLVRHLSLRRAPDGAGTADLASVLGARLAQLSAPARLLLEVVSVAGRPLSPGLAVDAAGLGEAARTELIDLQEERLLRTAPLAAGAGVEVYHDRIRELLVTRLGADALQSRHRGLAYALVKEHAPDAQALFRHFLGAGEREPAAHWAVEAAEHADSALAFAEAADTYRRALELVEDHNLAFDLQVKRATALVNAGRGAEAAPIFLDAAGRAAGAESLELRRRAAEQFLVTGRIDQGVDAMQSLLRDVGLRYPRTTPGAAASTALRLVAIAARRPATARFHGGARLDDLDSIRIEASRSAAKGLAMVDPFRGLYFAVRTLSLALRSGDPRLIAREIAGVGATLVPAGGPAAAWAGRLLDRARELAIELDDPYLLGLTAITLAQKRMVEGRWREMLELCDTGVGILRERCRGVAWELAIGSGPAERALEELGRMAEMGLRGEAALREAEASEDMFRVSSSLQTIALARISQNRLGEARDLMSRARSRWTLSGFHFQHFYILRIETLCDLGEANNQHAWDRLLATWPELKRSNLLRHQLVRLDAHLLRARVALALAISSPAQRPDLLRRVVADAAVLEKEGRPDSGAYASQLRGAVAAQKGDRASALAHLDACITAFTGSGMLLGAALARLRVAQILGNPAGASMLSAAHEGFESLAVSKGEALATIYAPGFPV